MNEPQLSPIPWYRTRKFWGIIFGFMFTWSIFFYFSAFYNPNHNFERILLDIAYAFGSTLFSVLGFGLLGKVGGYIGTSIYLSFMTIIMRKTFQNIEIRLIYPIVFLIIYITANIITFLYFGSFG